MLSPLLHQVQIGLFILSGMLGLGAVYGLLVGAESVSEGMSPLTSSARKSAQNEQRRMPRTNCDMDLELMDEAEHTAGSGRLLNISATGACFVSTSILLKDDTVMARLPSMRSGANKISGRVIWLRSRPGNTLYGIRLNPATRV